MNQIIRINQISLLMFQSKSKARLFVNLAINSVDFKGFIISHRFSKIHMRKIQISHGLKDSMREHNPHNV